MPIKAEAQWAIDIKNDFNAISDDELRYLVAHLRVEASKVNSLLSRADREMRRRHKRKQRDVDNAQTASD